MMFFRFWNFTGNCRFLLSVILVFYSSNLEKRFCRHNLLWNKGTWIEVRCKCTNDTHAMNHIVYHMLYKKLFNYLKGNS